MSGGVEGGKRKLQAKASSMASNWNARKGEFSGRYAEGLRAAGITVGPQTQAAYQAGLSGATVGPVNVEKWARNYMQGMSR